MQQQNIFAKALYYYGFIESGSYDKVKIKCPFHNDIKPSMLVDLKTDTFYCFGCQEKGNVIQFIKKVNKCNDLKAYSILNKILKSKELCSIKIVQADVKTNKEYLADAKHYFYTLPDTNWDIISEASKYMRLKRGFSRQVLEKCDVRENFNTTYGIIAPMLDNGKFKGYVCRATIDVDRKYLYNKGFSRSNTIVGEYNTDGWVVITEGFMDYLKLKQFGVEYCGAILGWKITDRQISKLQKYTGKIISALDNTETGEKGTEYLKQWFDVKRFEFSSSIKDVGDLDKWQFNKCWADTLRQINLKK